MARFGGFRPRHMWVDEAAQGITPSAETVLRHVGDDWDVTSAGVLLHPIPLGTTVEVFDAMREQYFIGEVVRRERRSNSAGSWVTTYNVRCEGGEVGAGREYLAVFDRSPEGIERWLEGEDRPRTPEEIERWLGDA